MTDGPVGQDRVVRVCRRHSLALEERGDRLVCPGPPKHAVTTWRVVDRAKGRALWDAAKDKEGVTEMNESTTVKEKAPQKSMTLERAKFEDGTKLVLFVRLTKEPKRWGGDPFRVRWQQLVAGAAKGSVQGVSKTCPDEISGRSAFKAAVRSAIEQGWKPVAIGRGIRSLQIKPIPAPKKRAA